MIKVTTATDMKVATGHPAQEARDAKTLCDRLLAGHVTDYEIKTVSTDAVSMFEYYGHNVLGFDMHYFVNGIEVDFQQMFESFNESFAVIEQYGRDIDE